MFTQCPKCEAAFRITAELLQQADGQVRCGNCERAFNALDHLYEEPPGAAPTSADSVDGSGEDKDERSKALLETLDRLAGPDDVHIEDTGVEWLVHDEQEESAADEDARDSDKTASMRWVLEDLQDDAAAGVPEVSDEAPVDASVEVDLDNVETAEQLIVDEKTALEFDPDSLEPRYDDNTPLPDDFEEQHDFVPAPNHPQRRSTDQAVIDFVGHDETQTELELSEPGDWTDLLDEVGSERANDGATASQTPTEAAAVADPKELPLEVEEELAAIHDELAVLPEASDGESADVALEIEDDDLAITLDTNPDPDAEPKSEIAVVASQLDDLLEAMGTDRFKAAGHDVAADAVGDERAQSDKALSLDEDAVDEAADDLADEAQNVEAENGPAESAGQDTEEIVLDDSAAAEVDDGASAARPEVELDGQAIDYEEPTGEFERAIADAEGSILAERAETESEPESTDAAQISSEHDPYSAIGSAVDADTDAAAGVDDLEDDFAAMTGNMKIDADLLRAMKDGDLAASMTNEDGSPIVESIVMEGDFVGGTLDDTFGTGEIEVPAEEEDPGSLVDTYMMNRLGRDGSGIFSGKRAIAGIIVLVLLLIGQFIHTSRQSLATFGAFNQTIGPLYRMFGSPVTPTWDIKGWQFEATNGSTGEDNDLLTIYSRISNRARQPLPYPLVHVSLTDRYEEIIGSRVLEPNEYLAGNADPRRPVAAGDRFTAVITIASPSPEATGFKLNVCYRVALGRVRCAIEDFKAP